MSDALFSISRLPARRLDTKRLYVALGMMLLYILVAMTLVTSILLVAEKDAHP